MRFSQGGHGTEAALIGLIKIKWEIVKPNTFQTSQPTEEARARRLLSNQDKLDCSLFTGRLRVVRVICILSVLSGSAGFGPTDSAALCVKWIFCLRLD